MGFSFFALWPIAVNFPEYRLLVSPVKRIFWNIPTHGTIAFYVSDNCQGNADWLLSIQPNGPSKSSKPNAPVMKLSIPI
jgi:hypothetical protein